jgi:hypothetical protein
VNEGTHPDLRIERRGAGNAAWGRGFYVWDVDAGELLRDAGALARASGGAPGGGAPAGPQDARRARASSASRRRASIAAR